jgi:hypothetical protein
MDSFIKLYNSLPEIEVQLQKALEKESAIL